VGLANNRDTCLGCGFCNFGCRYDRKTSMLVTFIPWAEKRGAVVIDQVRHATLVHGGDRVAAVEYERFGRRHRIEAETFVTSCGAIGSSELLLRSGVRSRAKIGHAFHALGGVLVAADMPERIDAFDRVGLTCMLADAQDFVTETFFAPPAAFAISLNGLMDVHTRRMQRYAHMAEAGVMVGTAPTGRIEIDGQRTHIHLSFSQTDVDRLRRGIKQLARIYLAGGAKAVYPGTFADFEIKTIADVDKLDAVVQDSADLSLGSAHPQGGNPMAADPTRGVVGQDFRVHGYANLFVADASVFPTNLWANCQATVMAMSYLAADHVLTARSAA
jgi:choline dehydrogenase-like flavoprotein